MVNYELQFTFDGVENLSMHSSYNESPPEQSPDAEEYFGKWDSGSEDRYCLEKTAVHLHMKR